MLVVALRDGADVWFGFDSVYTTDRKQYHINYLKGDNFILAVAGSPLILDIIKPLFIYPEVNRDVLLQFIPVLQERVGDKYGSYSILVGGVGGLLFKIENYNVFETSMDAIGDGWKYALGALHIPNDNPKLRVEQSIRTAIKFEPKCGGRVETVKI